MYSRCQVEIMIRIIPINRIEEEDLDGKTYRSDDYKSYRSYDYSRIIRIFINDLLNKRYNLDPGILVGYGDLLRLIMEFEGRGYYISTRFNTGYISKLKKKDFYRKAPLVNKFDMNSYNKFVDYIKEIYPDFDSESFLMRR